MKIVIPGGSGQVGRILARAFHGDGHEVTILSRNPTRTPWRAVDWDGKSAGPWTEEFNGADIVINLAGRSVNCRYSEANRREIMNSRLDSTRAVGEAIRRATPPPRIWLQAATATIYAHRFDAANDENTGIIGGLEDDAPDTWRFSIDVATRWEATANEFSTPPTRLVLLRSAVTMSPDRGGIFDTLLGLVRRGLGGTCGDGLQFVSWIHEADFVRAVYWLIENDSISGPVNLASPHPLSNADFMRVLRDSWGAPIGLPATRWMLEIGAFFMRTETELILKSRRVAPGILMEHGFRFKFPDWKQASGDLCRRWRIENRNPR